MPRHLIAVLTLAAGIAVASLAPSAARASDGIFGSLFSRLTNDDKAESAPRATQAQESRDREREARNLRREYWERERNRIAQNALAREAANQAVASR
jgi:hypothetical protein